MKYYNPEKGPYGRSSWFWKDRSGYVNHIYFEIWIRYDEPNVTVTHYERHDVKRWVVEVRPLDLNISVYVCHTEEELETILAKLGYKKHESNT